MEDLQVVEEVMRKDEKVIEQCGILGIPRQDMHKVYCDCMLHTGSTQNLADICSLDHWLR